jgi:FkbM family methyltransferase
MGLFRYVPDRPKQFAKRVLGQEIHYRPNAFANKQMHGDNDGLWCLCPDELSDKTVVYSFGIGTDISFDLSLIETYGVTVHAFDPTPKSIQWLESQTMPDNFVPHPFGLADHDGEVSFNPPINSQNVSHTMLERPETSSSAITVPVFRLPSIMQQLGHKKIDVLKVDIEGAEYCFIDDLARTLIRPNQILIEFHHRFPGIGIPKTKRAIQTLKNIGYDLYHVSVEQSEFCFKRKANTSQLRIAA